MSIEDFQNSAPTPGTSALSARDREPGFASAAPTNHHGQMTSGDLGRPEAIVEKQRATPLACEADVCVVGESCTGVFTAVRARAWGSGWS